MVMTRDFLVKKYIINIIFIIATTILLTWFWFGPYQHKVRVKESLQDSNIKINLII